MSLSIGVDVGETNTTAVILKEKEVLCSSEVPTRQDVTSGVIEAIELVLRQLPEEHAHNRGENFEKVSIGATLFENAVKQGKNLSKVALFRLCYPATVAIPPPCVPALHKFFYLNGGCETDGTTITHVDEDQLTQKTKEVYIEGITHIAIVGVYSPKYTDQEDRANRVISSTSPEMKITLSHKVCDEEDFLKREHLSIMNESLRPLCEHTVETLSTALMELGLKCPFYFTRGDGKLISFEDTRRFPVLTLTSGLTNSMRGAAFLTGVQNGIVIVIDIGGTNMHVGSIKDGFPKHLSGKEGKTVSQTLTTKALVFGGKATTATDIAVASGFSDIGDKEKMKHLSQKFQEGELEDVKKKIQAAIDQAKPSDEAQPVIVVGGGANLLNPDNPIQFKGASKVIIPRHFQVANAVGAAVAVLEQYTREPSPLQKASILLQLAKSDVEETILQTEPFIDPVTGDWILKKYDIECITLGAGIMACGGGGNTNIGKLRAMASLERNGEIRVVHPGKLGTEPELTGPVAVVALMGNPMMVCERLISGLESASALKKMEEGHCPEDEPSSRTEPVALLCIEMGGISTTEPLAVAGDKKIRIVDADGMGRANPVLEMFLPYVYGSPTSFSAIGDEKGNTQSFCANCPKEMEEHYRKAIGEMGEMAGIAFTINWTFVSEATCPLYSLSRLRKLGNTVLEARKKKQDPVESIIEHENGKIIFQGEIVEVTNGGGGGFCEGTIIIEGSRPEADLNEKLYIAVKNENYLAYVCDVKGDKTYLAAVPDLISLVKEDGSAITTEMVQKDLHVSVIAMPCNPLWKTKKGKKAGGPAAFGCHDDVKPDKPLGKYKWYPPIPQIKTDH
ncbi:uncharacterized protein LOC111346055 isoform X2 [Stylophora pistillata]|uniref:uncharacterized protein LOC111346055 isoform X2 n=1 Tax=Stylophora pistillata TaxID=50429 RepID=UPI000C03AB7C|nr:uncharacterized protein LOC111346055 isoform X2 [Stylophora pistillata]